jgi:hypothetical protein
METVDRKKWRAAELNLVKGASKQRQAEDKLRADAWMKTREAELEAVLGRSYNGMDVPGIPEIIAEASRLMAPLIAEFDRLYAAAYPAEFAKATLGIVVRPGGIPPEFREQVRRDATRHLTARHRYMLANSSGYVTETLTEAALNTTNNPEVREMLERLAVPNRATPTLESPGPAIGILKKLLPNPEEWGFAGYDDGTSPLLPAPEKAEVTKTLPSPETKKRTA